MPLGQKSKSISISSIHSKSLNAWGIFFAVVLSFLTLGLFPLLRLILGYWLLPSSAFNPESNTTVAAPAAAAKSSHLKKQGIDHTSPFPAMSVNIADLTALHDLRVQGLIKKYYLKKMPIHNLNESFRDIHRTTHGASHVTRVWALANILDANICHDLEVDLIDDLAKMIDPGSPDDVKSLIRWLPIMHDCGRQGGGA